MQTTAQEREVETAYVRFFLKSTPYKDNGVQKFRDVEWCEIEPQGDPFNKPIKEVDDVIRKRFATQYRAFVENREAEVEGTDVRNWRMITPAQADMCRSVKAFSVEQLAAINANVITNLGPDGHALKRMATEWVNGANDDSAKLISENERLSSEVEALTAELEELKAENKVLASKLTSNKNPAKKGDNK